MKKDQQIAQLRAQMAADARKWQQQVDERVNHELKEREIELRAEYSF